MTVTLKVNGNKKNQNNEKKITCFLPFELEIALQQQQHQQISLRIIHYVYFHFHGRNEEKKKQFLYNNLQHPAEEVSVTNQRNSDFFLLLIFFLLSTNRFDFNIIYRTWYSSIENH